MSRIELAGPGGPIPTIALPDPNLSDDLAPQSFLLETGNFLKADWVGLGYTHFEVTCIGAAGGHGSNGGKGVTWPYYFTPLPGGHLLQHWYDPFVEFAQICGGAGGGGGLHRVSGLLADLPAITPVVVGAAGAVGPNGDTWHKDPYMPTPPPPSGTVWDLPHEMIPVPVGGGDGGASSFNVDTCVASGGKGGFPATVWDPTRPSSGYNFPGEVGASKPDGRGGQGGKGGQAVAGGGGAGAFFTVVDFQRKVTQAKDGTWNGVIGEGGGGGLAGEYIPGWRPQYAVGAMAAGELEGPTAFSIFDDNIVEATPGGKGSFSYSDTSVYGQRQDRSTSYYEEWGRVPLDTMVKGEIVLISQTATGFLIVPGGGGGARLNKLQGFGSHAPGFSPEGAVFIRIFVID